MQEWLIVKGEFIAVVILGALVKVFFSEDLSPTKAAGTATVAVFSAWVFTHPTLNLLAWWTEGSIDTDAFVIPVAAMWTLIGEGIMRQIVSLSRDNSIAGIIRNFLIRILGGSKNGK